MAATGAGSSPAGMGAQLGEYELLHHLATGGMADVFLARRAGAAGFSRHLVVKRMRAYHADDPEVVAMFLDEARLASTLHHPNIAQVFDLGECADGSYYLAMEYVHGESVRAILDRARALGVAISLELALSIVAAAAAGVHHAHEQRGSDGRSLAIVHRDVTPANVLVGYDGVVKLIDFGIAKARLRATQTQVGCVKGKAGYMAPEQARGAPVDRRTDVFALGAVLYELTTQARAFRATSELEAAQRCAIEEVVRPSRNRPGYPPFLEGVVLAALDPEPAARFADAATFAAALESVAVSLGLRLGPATIARELRTMFGERPEPWVPAVASAIDRVALPLRPSVETPARAWVAAPPVAEVRVGGGVEVAHAAPVAFIGPRASVPPVVFPVGSQALPRLPPALIGADAPEVTPTSQDTMRFWLEDVVPPPPLARVPDPPAAPSDEAPAAAPVVRAPTVAALTRGRVRRLAILTAGVIGVVGAVAGVAVVAGTDGAGAKDAPLVAPAPAAFAAAPTPAATPAPAVATAPAPAVAALAPAVAALAPAGLVADARAAAAIATSVIEAIAAPRGVSSTIVVRIDTTPSDATVLVDGVRLGRTPLTATLRRQDRPGLMKVRKRGYATQRIEIALDADLAWRGLLHPR